MATELWTHQAEAVAKLAPLGCGALFMEMGDGKSRTAIELILRWGCRRVLVLCPLKVVRVWPMEFRKHIGDEWACSALDTGTIAERSDRLMTEALCAACDDVPYAAAVNYDALVHEPLPATLAGLEWDCIICDEAHRLKQNDGLQSTTVAQLARRIPHRLLLTGTPMPHSPLDIFGQWRILDPNTFGGNWWRFQNRYAVMEPKEIWRKVKGGKPTKRTIQVIARDPLTNQPMYRHIEELQAKIAPLCYRSSGAIALPDVVDETVYCLLEPRTQRVYHDLERDFVANFGAVEDVLAGIVAGTVTAPNALVKALRLAQVCNGFAHDTATGNLVPLGTEKADLLADVMEDLPAEEPIVVFGRFVEDLAIIARVSKAQGRAYAEVSGRRNELEQWQAGEGNVLGVQLQAGGVGVDFTRARYQVYFSHDYSLGNYMQTRKRIHRPGQTRKVTYIHLLAAGTVDETVMTALQRRQETVGAVVEGLR